MIRNSNAKVLTYKIGPDKWSVVTKFQINEYMKFYHKDEQPRTNRGAVKLFMKDAEVDGLSVRLNRFFDTVEYEKEQRGIK